MGLNQYQDTSQYHFTDLSPRFKIRYFRSDWQYNINVLIVLNFLQFFLSSTKQDYDHGYNKASAISLKRQATTCLTN